MSLQQKNRQRPVSAIVSRRDSARNSDLVAPPSAFKQGSPTHGRNRERQLTSTRNLKSTLETIKFEKFMGNLQDPFEHQSTRVIWRALGSFIAKQLISGKAVIVPKFGLFTFTASEVCLSGTTNPQQRDRQHREPVFMVGKDFVSGIERANNNFISDQDLKSGICTGDAIRPMALKGANGVIPQVKTNYFEIGLLCGESKDSCRDTCERIFKWFSDRVRKGEQVSGTELPLVGRFLVRSRVAAFNFLPSLVEQTRGMTTKQFTVGNIFGNLDATHNLNMHVKDQLAKTLGLRGGSQVVSNNAAGWLKTNMGIDINTLAVDTQIASPIRPQRTLQRGGSEARLPLQLSLDNLSRLGSQTPNRGLRSNGARSVTSSRPTTAMASHMSQLPTADRSSLMALVVRIQGCRTQIVEKVKEATKFSLRDVLPSSKILTVMRNAGVEANIIQIKQLLRELGFPFNGPSTSIAGLLSATNTFLHGVKHVAAKGLSIDIESDGVSTIMKGSVQSRPDLQKMINTIRDAFYTTQKSMFNLFRMAVGVSGQQIDRDGFLRLVYEVSGGALPTEDAGAVFKGIAKTGKMTFELFEKTFRSEVPTSFEMETKVIRQVREWMFLNHLSAETAFDTLCKVVSKFIDKRLDRTMFQKAFSSLEIGLSAAQVDGLFTLLVSEAMGDLDLNMWLSRIYEDGDNPLQMIREIVQQHNLTQDDLMFQMKLKLWDEPLTQQRVVTAIRNLDQSISDSQVRALFTCLKDSKGLVSVAILIQNLTGKAFETVDFRNKIFKKLYEEIYPNKEAQLLSLLQEFDKENNGMVKSKDVLVALQRTITSVSKDDLERFVRFLETNRVDKLSYTEFMSKVTDTNKKAHNPFRTLVNRLGYFLKNNSITVGGLLIKIAGQENHRITVQKFAEFLKQKVDKKSELDQLRQLSEMLDVDKDGLVMELDITTCLKNLSNAGFWGNRNVKVALNFDKAAVVVQQIHDAMGRQKLSFRTLFDLFDNDKDNMVSLVEFQRGLLSVLSLSGPIVEQLYNLMDKSGLGLVNYDQFLEVIKAQKFTQVVVRDNFDWELQIVEQLRQWIILKSLNAEEAFKCFDKDFDGFISSDDLKKGLINNLNVPLNQIVESKMERLYRLLDTFKTGKIQLSDFQRLAKNNTDSFDWKKSAIQQAGLLMSKKYSSLAESFALCSKQQGKVNFESLNTFFTEQSLLNGFSLTPQLLQELFSSLDPHKKGYLSYNDWKNAFSGFNYHDHLLLELKTLLTANFANYDSAYKFLLSFGTTASIDQAMFTFAVSQLSNERFKQDQLLQLWSTVNANGTLDKFQFRQHFGMLSYTGSQQVTTRSKSVTIKSASTHTSAWETNVIEKIRGLLKTSTRTMQEIFAEFNPDGEGQITQNEFRNAIRKLNLGISSKEIDQLMIRVDANKDGLINFNEFSQKFGKTQHDSAMQQRANDKLAQIKELMVLHMNSPIDAFRYFDEEKEGKLSFGAFFRLMTKCYEVAHLKPPAYPVVKDLFDTIDIRKDGSLDLKEWQQTFGQVTEGGNQLSLKATPLAQWETSREFENIGQLMAKHRKLVVQCFKDQLSLKGGSLFTFKEGKSALDNWLYQNFRGQVSDAQLKCVFRVAQAQLESQHEPMYDYMRLVDVYKARHSGPQK